VEGVIYLDTHVVAWLYAGRVDLFSARAKKLIDSGDLCISPMVTLELEYLREIGRLTVGGNAVVQGLSAQIGLRVCDLSFAAVVESALDQRWTRDPFDRLIVGHAALAASVLVTKDETIRRRYRDARW
jgi:PIN domain nuclease of toxin-antitoxin system